MSIAKAGDDAGSVIYISDNIAVDVSRRFITLSKKSLVTEDIVAIEFASALDEVGVSYTVVAGYVAILFGRSRRSDDIDFIVEQIDMDSFLDLCRVLRERGFDVMQGDICDPGSLRRLYERYLAEAYAVRFMYRDVVIPNIEFRFAKTLLHKYSIENSLVVILNNRYRIRIAPLELQIAYKLFMGSNKDVGDAVFLYTLFKPILQRNEIRGWCEQLGIDCSLLEEVVGSG